MRSFFIVLIIMYKVASIECSRGFRVFPSLGRMLRLLERQRQALPLALSGHLHVATRSVLVGAADVESSAEAEEDELGPVNLSYPAYMVWGANTGVGKTLVSAGLAAAVLNSGNSGGEQWQPDLVRNVLYVKPVQTGYPEDSDARFVSQRIDRILGKKGSVFVSNHTMRVSQAVDKRVAAHFGMVGKKECVSMPDYAFSVEQSLQSQLWKSSLNCEKVTNVPSTLTCKTLWSWCSPVSPHLAAEEEGGTVSNATLLETLRSSLWRFNRNCTEGDGISKMGKSWALVETAGGVATPGPSGTLQCDLYRPLRLPGILVGDGRLGGISSTVAAYESLLLRGYETICIVVQDCGFANGQHLSKHLDNKLPVLVLPPVPQESSDDLVKWFQSSGTTFSEVRALLEDAYLKRIQRLDEMPKKASELLWWPFTQHSLVPLENISVIDSRCGENFSVYKSTQKHIVQQFDACASWWTQGPDTAMQHELSKQIALAAGRYGHVMFPENVHEPGLKCAELLLQGVGQGWAHRVYFSDNGSTSVEIAIKMAFRKFALDCGYLSKSTALRTVKEKNPQFKVLALRGSYHGDTLGAMEAQASSPFTGFLQQPWYSGRGLFLEPATVFYRDSKWHLNLPEDYCCNVQDCGWETREDVFAAGRDSTDLAKLYSSVIVDKISKFDANEDAKIAALIIEPIIHAAGGMEVVDPLFQRILVQECKCRCIPVIFDEVFTGCWRLGAESAAEILGCNPDIACYAKLLTGGIVPLAATLASEAVFQAFEGPSKLDALLHGHSYTAHPIGCAAAVTALQWFKDPSKNLNLLPGGSRLQELWDPDLVAAISRHPAIQRVISMGTVFAVELRTTSSERGYSSMSSKSLIQKLRDDGVHVRPLGNVVYLMCGPTTRPSTCSAILNKLLHQIRALKYPS